VKGGVEKGSHPKRVPLAWEQPPPWAVREKGAGRRAVFACVCVPARQGRAWLSFCP
jgi:hypothetical protein